MQTATKPQHLDMLNGPIWNKLPRYALPVAATGILGQLFNAADIAVVGNFTGDMRTAAVAAVGANSPVIGLLRRNGRLPDFPKQQIIITNIYIPGINHDAVTIENKAGKPRGKRSLKKRRQCRYRRLHYACSKTASAVQRIMSCRLSSHGLSGCGAFFPISFHIGSSPQVTA